MKTTFRLFGLKEMGIVTYANLSPTGISTDKEWVTVRTFLGDFDSKLEAFEKAKEIRCEWEFGFEIVETFNFNS